MAESLETIAIRDPHNPEARLVINQIDYKSDIHTLWDEPIKRPRGRPRTSPAEEQEGE